MTKIFFFPMIATSAIAIFYFNIIRLLLLVTSDKNILEIKESMQHLWNYDGET